MIEIYNTLSQQKEPFKPLTANHIKMYVCGITVYDFCHLGHVRMLIVFDMMLRYFRSQGYTVNYVRNITDIDDKIIKRAKENNETVQALTERFIHAMDEDLATLGLQKPDHEPRATQYIPQMIQLVEKLLTKNHAYIASNGDVFFAVRSFAEYGCLSHRNIDQLESGARVEINDVKNDPLDFVLWKSAKPGEPAWDSPWGAGRPGWHLECSTMSMDILGEHFDLHGGGRDLIFPHHENEIAQSCAATNKPFVNVWAHNGYVQINDEKMSKSLGNFLTIRDLLQKHSAEVIRYFIIASQYRSPLQYSDQALVQAHQALERFYIALRNLPAVEAIQNTEYAKRFFAAMDDDFNTPVALAVLFDLAHEIQRLRDKDKSAAARHAALLKELAGTLGLLQADAEAFLQGKLSKVSEQTGVDAAKIDALIAARNQARADKNWAEADRIRDELNALSVVLEDTAEGTSWRVK